MNDPKILEYSQQLKKLNIEHKIVEHPDLRTPAEVQEFLELTLADGLSTMIMKADDSHVAVIRRDDCRLDFGKIKKILGVKSLRMASAEEYTMLTNLPLGAARVYNPGLKTLLDLRLFEKEFLTGGTGSFTCSFRYKSEHLRRIPNSSVVEITESPKEGVSEQHTGVQRVFSGIRATGRLHLGNYLGAVKGMLALQNDSEYETIYGVVNIHATTTPYDPKTLPANTRSVVLDYLSCGMDPKKSCITVQSDLADIITQLSFYFSTVVSVGRMQDLPTFKEKVRQYPKNVTMALLNYPVLMAADILIYKASLVPVGIDQEPHLEVAREIARRMNETYGTDFPEPKRFATVGEYVPSLTGEGKMSKTVEESYISLTDSLETIKRRLASVPTNTGRGTIQTQSSKFKAQSDNLKVKTKAYISNGQESHGVATLMEFVELFQGKVQREEYERQYQSTGIRYAELKQRLAEAIYRELEPIQKKRAELEKQPEYVEQVLKNGAKRARSLAEQAVREVREKMGLAR